MRVLVTGGTGFIGTAVRDALSERGVAQRLALRAKPAETKLGDAVVVGEIHRSTDWRAALSGVSAVVHLAARVHVMHETTADPASEFRRVNTQGTEHLARAAASAGVRRLVFVSSVKVNGESTDGRPFSPSDAPHPGDPYGVSKWEAEQALARVARDTGLEIVVVRPPLVYGPHVRGNFLRLMKLVRIGHTPPVRLRAEPPEPGLRSEPRGRARDVRPPRRSRRADLPRQRRRGFCRLRSCACGSLARSVERRGSSGFPRR